MENGFVIGCIRADDHLRALASRRKARWFDPGSGPVVVLRFIELEPQPAHGAADRADVFFGREFGEAGFLGYFDVDAEPVGIFAGLGDQRVIGFRNGLQMDVAAEVMLLAQFSRDGNHLFHGVIGAADDAGREKQALDVVASIEVDRQFHYLIRREARPRHIAGSAVDAIKTIVIAGIGEQDFQQRDAASVRCIGMTDAHAGRRRAEAFAIAGVPFLGAAGGAGSVVFGGIGQDFQLALHVHP